MKIQLPFEIGDKIYIVPSITNYRLNCMHKYEFCNKVHEQKIVSVNLCENNVYLVCTQVDYMKNYSHSNSFNETWFLNKEDAEKKLNELRKECE